MWKLSLLRKDCNEGLSPLPLSHLGKGDMNTAKVSGRFPTLLACFSLRVGFLVVVNLQQQQKLKGKSPAISK